MGCSSSSYERKYDLNTSYREVRFLQKESRNTDRYFHHLYERIGRSHSAEEVPLIQKAVETLISSLLLRAGSNDQRFRTSEEHLLMVGPFYGGVKIGYIDEFQYMIVLDDFLLNEGQLMIEPYGGLLYGIYIPDESDIQFFKSWNKLLRNGYLKSCEGEKMNTKSLLGGFCFLVRDAVRNTKPEVTPFGEVGFADDCPVVIKDTRVEINLIFRQKVTTFYRGKKIQDVEPHSFTAAITPAIRNHHVDEFVKKEDVVDENFLHTIKANGSFLLVPEKDGLFRGVFTENEHEIVKSFSTEHKKAFCVIQFLILGIDDGTDKVLSRPYEIFDLDIVTLFMMHLQPSCPCSKPRFPDYETFDCVMHVMNAMHASLYDIENSGYDVTRNLSSLVRGKWMKQVKGGPKPESKLYWNRVYFRELLWHDLRNWIGTLEKYNLKISRPLYGAAPLNRKLMQINE